tara:strand:- start:423 stop:1157 length:735 start_codon:yes stop_codon:yes gene_type:complete
VSNIKERPLILTAQEVNAVLAGDKTQHRIIIENTKDTQCLFNGDWRYDGRDFLDSDGFIPDPKGAHYVERLEPSEGEERQYTEDYRCVGHCPFGVVGDRLWVKEFHARTDQNDHLTRPHYYADGTLRPDLRHDAGLLIKYSAADMPRWASRLLLEITDIRIERLNDISEQDAIAEGIKYIHADPKDRSGPNHFTKSNGWYHCSRPTAAEVFKEMYTVSDDYEEHGENPWVWVIDFKAVKESDNG